LKWYIVCVPLMAIALSLAASARWRRAAGRRLRGGLNDIFEMVPNRRLLRAMDAMRVLPAEQPTSGFTLPEANLYIIRHGESEANVMSRSGLGMHMFMSDPGLTRRGMCQAAALGRMIRAASESNIQSRLPVWHRLNDLPTIEIDRDRAPYVVFASPLKRAIQTAIIVCRNMFDKGVPGPPWCVVVMPGLVEQATHPFAVRGLNDTPVSVGELLEDEELKSCHRFGELLFPGYDVTGAGGLAAHSAHAVYDSEGRLLNLHRSLFNDALESLFSTWNDRPSPDLILAVSHRNRIQHETGLHLENAEAGFGHPDARPGLFYPMDSESVPQWIRSNERFRESMEICRRHSHVVIPDFPTPSLLGGASGQRRRSPPPVRRGIGRRSRPSTVRMCTKLAPVRDMWYRYVYGSFTTKREFEDLFFGPRRSWSHERIFDRDAGFIYVEFSGYMPRAEAIGHHPGAYAGELRRDSVDITRVFSESKEKCKLLERVILEDAARAVVHDPSPPPTVKTAVAAVRAQLRLSEQPPAQKIRSALSRAMGEPPPPAAEGRRQRYSVHRVRARPPKANDWELLHCTRPRYLPGRHSGSARTATT